MKSFIEDIKSNLVVLALFCTMIIWYANVNSRLATAEDDIADLKTIMAQNIVTHNDINVKLGKIETSVEFIKDKLK